MNTSLFLTAKTQYNLCVYVLNEVFALKLMGVGIVKCTLRRMFVYVIDIEFLL